MPFSLITSVVAAPGGNGGTTGAINTTGANLITVVISDFAAAAVSTLSDSKSNTWVGRTVQSGSNVRVRIFDCLNPTVGSGHTFTYSPEANFPLIRVVAWAGAHATAAFDQQNGTTGTGTSIQPGSVTPTQASELIVVGWCWVGSTTEAIDAPFTIQGQTDVSGGVNFGGALAYEIQTTATARNPTISGGTTERAIAVATYKAASGLFRRNRYRRSGSRGVAA